MALQLRVYYHFSLAMPTGVHACLYCSKHALQRAPMHSSRPLSHEQNTLLHVLGQPSCPGLLVQGLTVVDNVEVTT